VPSGEDLADAHGELLANVAGPRLKNRRLAQAWPACSDEEHRK